MSQLPAKSNEREDWPLWTYLTEYFPDSFLAEVQVAVAGNKQHNAGEKTIRWAREKSTDHMNRAMRHMWDHSRGQIKDTDGTYHLARARWRLGAALQEVIENEKAQQRLRSAYSTADTLSSDFESQREYINRIAREITT